MKRILTYLLCACLVVAPGCSVLSPEQRATARQQIEAEYVAGTISQAQRDAAIEALNADESFDWTLLGVAGVNIVLALLGAPAIVRLQRGAPTQKIGLPASKIHAET